MQSGKFDRRTTPDNITSLKENQIFVFGSNLSGRHGKGAAKTAMGWGAKMGQGSGLQGNTYGIPTKNANMNTLHLNAIESHIIKFVEFAVINPNNIFMVTEIGCGLAGYKPKQIAPLFKNAVDVDNIHLPYKFWRVLMHYL